MKKTNLLLTLIMIVSTIASSWATERTAPSLPTPVKFEAGKSYYLYNVESKKFICSISSGVKADSDIYGAEIYVDTLRIYNNRPIVYFKNPNYKYYLRQIPDSTDHSVTSYSTSSSNPPTFALEDTLNGYKIVPSNVYHKNRLLASSKSSGKTYLWLRKPSIDTTYGYIWQFMDVENAEHYIALHKLYTALENSNATGFLIEKYENIYNNPESTTDELLTAATDLNNSVSLTNSSPIADWNDCPILLESTDKWNYSSSYIKSASLNSKNEQASIKAKINVDKHSTFVYEMEENYYYINCEVYINNKLVRSINYKPLSYKRRSRYFEKLEPGKYEIELRFINTYSHSETNYIYI